MRTLLSGRASEVSFDFAGFGGPISGAMSTVGSAGESRFVQQTWHDTWRRTGDEAIQANGRPLHTVWYQRRSEGNAFACQWDLLYDPEAHVFVRGVPTVIYGNGGMPNYDLIDITHSTR
jgi:hypothetical protein